MKRRIVSMVLTLCMVLGIMPSFTVTAQAAELPKWGVGITATTTTWDNGGTITTAEELAQFAYNVNNGNDYSGQTITLGNDIDISAGYWTAIGKMFPIETRFRGIFDGNNKQIKGLRIDLSTTENSSSAGGLFGFVENGEIKNLGLVDIDIKSRKGIYTGGIAVYNSGIISNSYSTGEIVVEIDANSANGLGLHSSGGLVGLNNVANSKILNSHTTVNITVNVTGYNSKTTDTWVGGLVGINYPGAQIIDSYATGKVTGKVINSLGKNRIYSGGLIGYGVGGTIKNCYAEGDVKGNGGKYNASATEDKDSAVGGLVGYGNSTIINSYATGNVTGDVYSGVGGLLGASSYLNENLKILNSYATGNVNGGAYSNVGGLVGHEMGISCTLSNSYATGNVTGGSSSSVGGLVGYFESGKITNGYYNSDADQRMNSVLQTTKKGVGYGTAETTGMESSRMKDASFVLELNSNLDTLENSQLYKWQTNSGAYPIFSTILWTEFKLKAPITISTIAPIGDATSTDVTDTPPTNATGPVVTWSADDGTSYTDASGEFVAGITYKTKYIYTANEGYEFDSKIKLEDITVTNIGIGQKNMALTDSNKTLTIIITWPKTLPRNWADGITSSTTNWDNGGIITTAQELAQFAYNVNNGKEYVGQTITLGNDIDLSSANWTPIGRIDNSYKKFLFKGIFDGKGKKITGIKIGSPTTAESELAYAGLFGYIEKTDNTQKNGIKNLGVDVEIYSSKTGAHLGAIAGSIYEGTVINSYATGNIAGGEQASIGGLVGSFYNTNAGIIRNNYVSCNVTGGMNSNVGSLLGRVDDQVRYPSFDTVRYNYWNNEVKQIQNNISLINKKAIGLNYDNKAQITDLIEMTSGSMKEATFMATLNINMDTIRDLTLYTWQVKESDYPTFSNILWTEPGKIQKVITIDTTAPVRDAAIVYVPTTTLIGIEDTVVTWSSDGGTNYVLASGNYVGGKAYQTKYVYTAKIGYEFDNTITLENIMVTNIGNGTRTMACTDNNKTLTIIVTWPLTAPEDIPYTQGAGAGTNSQLVRYTISTEAQLRTLATTVNNGTAYEYTTFVLQNNITLSDVDWTPIGIADRNSSKPFKGIFDGNNKKIKGLKIGSETSGKEVPDYLPIGLFGAIENSTIKNIGVDVAIYIFGSINSVGGLVGSSKNSTIKNSYATGNVGSATATRGYCGGLVGLMSEGSTLNNSYATGNVSGGSGQCVGGAVGYLHTSTMNNSYATGNITTGGNTSRVGGLVGYNHNSQITNGYWNQDAIQIQMNSPQTPKRGTGQESNTSKDPTIGMTSGNMKDALFAATLNSNLLNHADLTLYQWKVSVNGYPKFLNTPDEEEDEIAKEITINTIAPVKNATIVNGTTTAPEGTDAPVITWSADGGENYTDASGNFAAGIAYKTKYVYTARAGYVFDETITSDDITVTNLSGGTRTADCTDSKTLTIIVTWPETVPASNACDIISFNFLNPEVIGIIEDTNISLTVPLGTDLTAISPIITISENATIFPVDGEAKDFKNPVLYTVTAEDGATKKGYTVTVTIEANPDIGAVEAVKTVIIGGTVNVTFGAKQEEKTAAVQAYVNGLLKNNINGVTATVTYVSGNDYKVDISKGIVADTTTIPMTINESSDPDIATVNKAKDAAENANYLDMTQAVATSEIIIENALLATATDAVKAAVTEENVTVAIRKVSYTAPIAGTSANPNGTNGSYAFTVTVSKGNQTQTTTQKTIAIIATVFTGATDTEAVEAVKTAIVGGTVNVTFGAKQEEKTAAVQTYVNGLLKNNVNGVTATVTYVSGNDYKVDISKGSVADTTTISMTINESSDPDIATVNKAKDAAENANYLDMTQAVATSEIIIENALLATATDAVKAEVTEENVTVAIRKVSYTAPIAGTSANPNGTNGSYVFTVTVSKGNQTQTTQKTIAIIATVFTGATDKEAVEAVKTAIVGGTVNVTFGAKQEEKTAAVQAYVNGLLKNNVNGVTAIVTHVSDNDYKVDISKGIVADTTTISMTINESSDPAKELALEEAIKSVVTAEISKTDAAKSVAQALVTVLPNGPEKTALEVRLNAIVTKEDEEKAVHAAKIAIVPGTVEVTFGSTQEEKTAAIQSYINDLLKNNTNGVSATVAHDNGNNYIITISKGSVEETVVIEMTINESSDPDIATVNNAKDLVENATYPDMTQAEAADELEIANRVIELARTVVTDSAITLNVNKVSHTDPIAGTSDNPQGTDGSYTFVVIVNKGNQTQTTIQKIIIITATPALPTPLTHTINGVIKDTENNPVSGATVILTDKNDSSKTYTDITDATGNYIMTNVPDGNYTVTVTKANESLGSTDMAINGQDIMGGSANIIVTPPVVLTYIVAYNPNGVTQGTLPTDNFLYSKDAYARVLSKGTLTRLGYSFIGWNTQADGTGVSYKVNDRLIMTANRTLYAQWKKIESATIPKITANSVRGTEIVVQPNLATMISVTAEISDSGALSYQWYKNTKNATIGGTLITGATGSSYTPKTDVLGTTYYYVVLTNTLTVDGQTTTTSNTCGVREQIVLAKPAERYDLLNTPGSKLGNINLSNTSATQYQDYITSLTVESGYKLPNQIMIKVDGKELVAGIDYIYSKETGKLIVYNVIGQLTIEAIGVLIPLQSYTISFNPNGGSEAVAISGIYGTAIILPTPTKKGFNFTGWYRDQAFATSYTATTIGGESITLYAQWKQVVFDIDGNIVDEENNKVANATVKLMSGNREVGKATTGDNGTFIITGVPSGTYNLVVSKGDQTITLVITVSDNNIALGSVTLPKGKKNSVVDVKPNTPDIVVDKLNNFFESKEFTQDDSNIVDAGGKVEIKLVIEKKDESGDNAAKDANKIKAAVESKKTIGMFLDLTVSKIVTPKNNTAEKPVLISELDDLLIIEIPLPTELQGKSNYVIYRYHGSEVQTITQTENAHGEYIEMSADGNAIKLHTKKFSTYAIGYNKTNVTPPPSNDDDDDNTNKNNNSTSDIELIIKTDATDGGKITQDGQMITIKPDAGYEIRDVLVDGKSVGPVNQYTFKDATGKHTIKVIFIKQSQPDKKQNPFKDVNENDWFFKTVLEAYDKGIIVGISEDTFSPHTGTTRGMIAAIIHRLEKEPASKGTLKFNDVKADGWYTEAIAWGNEKGIIAGYGDGIFKPDQNITRQELCVILQRYAKYKGNDVKQSANLIEFKDHEDISSWALESVKWTVGSKIMKGKENKRLDPKGIATRAEVCAMILSLQDAIK